MELSLGLSGSCYQRVKECSLRVCVCVCVSGYLKKSGTNTTIDSSCVQSQTERTKVPPGLMIVTKLSDCYMFAVFILCVCIHGRHGAVPSSKKFDLVERKMRCVSEPRTVTVVNVHDDDNDF